MAALRPEDRPAASRPRPDAVRRRLLGASTLALGAALWSRGSAALDSPWREIDVEGVDPTRGRAVPVRLFMPAAASERQPVPLVVFSHGIGGSRFGYRYLGTHWAAQGVAALHLHHAGSDRSLWTRNPLDLLQRLRDAAQDNEAIARVADLRFALDRLLASPEGALIDARRIVAAGHSYGANTALLACGARVERQGRAVDLRDPRLKAAMLLSAPPFYGEASMQPILSPVTLPSLHVTCTEDVIRIPGYFSDLQDRLAVYEAVGSRRKALAVFEGGSHSVFTDWGGTGGVVRNPAVKAATQALTTAFLRSVLDGDETSIRDWPRRHESLLSRFITAG